MHALFPYLALWRRYFCFLLLGIVLAIVTLLASVGLLTLSGWFLSASALAGAAGLHSFNYMLPLSPAGLTRFRQGELLNSMVADVDTLDHLYLRVIFPLVGALLVIVVVTLGLSLLDMILALALGGIMLLILLLAPLFYRAAKPTGEAPTVLRGQWRQQLTG